MKKIFFLLLLISTHPHFSFCQQRKIDSLERVLKTENEDTNKVKTLNQITYLYTVQPAQNYQKALIIADVARQLSDKISYKRGAFVAYRNLGMIYGYFGVYEKSLQNYLSELKISEKLNDSSFLLQAHKDMSSIYNQLGNYNRSLKEAKSIEKMARGNGDKEQIAFALLFESTTYTNLCKEAIKKQDSNSATQNYNKAIECKLYGLQFSTELKDSMGTAFFYNDLGFIYDKCNLVNNM